MNADLIRRKKGNTVILVLLALGLNACVTGNPERRPYLVAENMDRAERHRQAGRLVEAAEIYTAVLLADPLNQIAANNLKEAGATVGQAVRPTAMGVNRTHAVPSPEIGLAIALYPFNRLLDLLDVVTMHAGLEGGLLAHAQATRALQAGLGGGGGVQLGWWQKRNLALGTGDLSELALGPAGFANESFSRAGTGGLQANTIALTGMSRPSAHAFQRTYDYYGIGVRAIVLLLGAGVELHPLEAADAVAGLLFIDFLHDDLGQTRRPRLDRNDRAAMDALVRTLSGDELKKNLQMLDQLTNQTLGGGQSLPVSQ